jgi:hypothetical protein
VGGSASITGWRCSSRRKLLKKNVRPPDFECEYLVGDDSCQAVKESDMGALRAEACRNEVKDACCYSCSLREQCSISCDLPELQKSEKEPENSQLPETAAISEAPPGMKCGDCRYYMKPKCPRSYSRDTELWRRQDPCEKFQPSKE